MSTTPYHHWKHDVLVLAKVSHKESEPHSRRMALWHDAGETREGGAKMLRIFVDGDKKRLVEPMTMARLRAVGCVFR